MRLSKVEILDRFRACCQKHGKTPGAGVFCKTAGVKKIDISYYWPRFSDLVKECGFVPQGWELKIPDTELFEEYAKVCLHLRKIPTRGELRIATRDLKTRIHVSTLVNRFGGSIIEFDHQFRAWLEKQSGDFTQILNFPGWDRKNIILKSETQPQPIRATYYFRPYLPACLQNLEVLAKGEVPESETSTESAAVLFERRCADAFRCLGFEITALGQGKGRMADCLAVDSRDRFALIVDAKVRREGYVLGTEDRKFLEYAVNHGRELQAKGFDKLYFVVVAASFRERDLEQLVAYLANSSPIRSVALVTAGALMRIVEDSIRERHSFNLNQVDKLFFGNKIINS